MSLQDLPEEGTAAKNVLFLDVGHAATQASIASFHKGKLSVSQSFCSFPPHLNLNFLALYSKIVQLQMLAASFDLSVGGLWFDVLIKDYFRAEFQQKFGSRANDITSW